MVKIIKIWIKTITLFYLFLFLAVFYFSHLGSHAFHLDEYLFLKKSYFFDLFSVKDFKNPSWWEENFDQPRLGPYIYGFSLHLKGINDIKKWQIDNRFNQIKISGFWWWEKLFLEKLADFPSELESAVKLIIYGRKIASLFSFSSLLILAFLGLVNKNLKFSFFSVLFLGLNRLMFYYGRVAMTDAFQLFFFFLNLLLLTLYLKAFFQKNKKHFLFLSFSLGIVSALATGVKVIGILSLLYSLAVNLVLFIINRKKKYFRSRILGLSFLLILFIFYFLFLSLNPQIYPQPIKGFWQMFSSRWHSAIDYQKQGVGRPIETRVSAFWFILKSVFLPNNRYGTFALIPFLPLDLGFFLAGLIILIKHGWQKFKKAKILGLEFILVFWFSLTFSTLLVYLRNDWPRFYLPLTAAVTLIQAYFFAWGTGKLLIIFKQRRKVLLKISKSVKKLKFFT